MATVNEKMTALADEVRELSGTTEAIGIDDMTEQVSEANNEVESQTELLAQAVSALSGKAGVNSEAIFEAGKAAGTDAFWDAIQSNGTRTDYSFVFINWGHEYIRPKHKVIPTMGNLGSVFATCRNLKKIESAYFDFSQLQQVKADYLCNACSSLEEFEDIGFFPQTYSRTWRFCGKLHTIAVIRSNESTTYAFAFDSCAQLQNIRIDGTIGQNGFDVSRSPLLTHESLMSIINALQSKTDGVWAIALGTENLAKLTDAEKAIATERGWTLA